MGKYKFTAETEMLEVYKAIANELAEANRLKIIELEMYKLQNCIEERFELEDKV